MKRQDHSPTSRIFLASDGNWYKTDAAQPGVYVPVSFAERVKAHSSPLFVEYAKRHGMTPEQYQTILDKRDKDYWNKERTSLLPFPLPDKYKNDADSRLTRDALNAVCEYRLLLKRFGPNRDEDRHQLKNATDVALGIRLAWSHEWHLELAEVPLAKEFKRPTDEDFARLEQWFLTSANAIKQEIARLEKLASGAKAKDGGGAAVAGIRKGFRWIGPRLFFGLGILAVLELLVLYGAAYWGEGDNLWQKTLNSWPFFCAIFAIWLILLPIILGKDRWQHLKFWKGDDK